MNVTVWKPGLNDGSQGEMPHLGMGLVAKEFKRSGHKVKILDGHFEHMTTKALKDSLKDTQLIAMSLVSLEWKLAQVQQILDFAKETHKKVYLGGPHAQGYWDLMQDDDRITKIIIGEFDGRLVESMSYKTKVVKVGHAKSLGTPDYSGMRHGTKIVAYPLYLSRGCTNLCSFCAGGRIHGRWRPRSIDEAMEELNGINVYPLVRRIYVVDDAFTGDINHAKSFLERYLCWDRHDRYELYPFNVRADQVDRDFLNLLKKAGVKWLPVGVESADPTVFKGVGKGETLDQIYDGIRKIQAAGIIPWLNMIVGLPGDNPERHENSFKWTQEIPDPKIVHWFQFAPFRGTRAYQSLVKSGDIPDGFIPSPYGRRYDDMPWVPDFGTPDFSVWQRSRAHLQSYLRQGSPVLINDHYLEKKTFEYDCYADYLKWKASASVEEYIKNELEFKKLKGQVA